MTREPVYHAYVDWHGHGGLNMGIAGWYKGTTATTGSVELSSTQWLRDEQSLKFTRPTLPQPFSLARSFTLPADVEVTASLWVYLETAGMELSFTAFAPDVGPIDTATTDVIGQWVQLDLQLLQTAKTDIVLSVGLDAGSGDVFYLGWSQLVSADDDVSCYLLSTREVPDTSFGREDARDTSVGMRTGEFGLLLNNETGFFTPRNPLSPITEVLTTSREILYTADFNDRTYNMYSGYTDNVNLNAGISDLSVEIACVDLLTVLANTPVHLDVFPSIRTGDAIKEVLRAIGHYDTFSSKQTDPTLWEIIEPFQDSGGTTLTWWTESENAKQALDNIIIAEGAPALYTIGTSGQIIFRDRHHRVRPTYQVATQTLVDCDDSMGPNDFMMYANGTTIDYGYTTYFNRVNMTNQFTVPATELGVVWTDPQVTRTITGTEIIRADVEPFLEGQPLIPGKRVKKINVGSEDETNVIVGLTPESPDFILESGTLTVNSYSVSGTTIELSFTAAGVAVISNLQFRGRLLTTNTVTTQLDDTGSQTSFNSVRPKDYDSGSSSENDAKSVGQLMLEKNSSPRPFVTIKVMNMDEAHTEMILGMDLSRQLNVEHTGWLVEAPFVVEGLGHEAGENGFKHMLTLDMQQVDPDGYNSNFIIFDEDGHGFDFGVFAQFHNKPFTFGSSEFGEDAFGLNAYTNDPIILGSSQLNSSQELWF